MKEKAVQPILALSSQGLTKHLRTCHICIVLATLQQDTISWYFS